MKSQLIIFFVLLYSVSFAQELTFTDESLIQFQPDIEEVLEHYPELDGLKIEVQEAAMKTSLSCRPKFSSLFKRKAKRTYVIRIDVREKDSTVTILDAQDEARIGVLGHEIAHIVDFQQRNFFGILGRGFNYLSKKSKEKYEKEIDLITIEHGLGYELYCWSDLVLNRSKATYKYKEFKREIYLEPQEILDLISE